MISANGFRNYACPLYSSCLDLWAARNAPFLPCHQCDLKNSAIPPPTDSESIFKMLCLWLTVDHSHLDREQIIDLAGMLLHRDDPEPHTVPSRYREANVSE